MDGFVFAAGEGWGVAGKAIAFGFRTEYICEVVRRPWVQFEDGAGWIGDNSMAESTDTPLRWGPGQVRLRRAAQPGRQPKLLDRMPEAGPQ